jgi:acetate kinase
MGMAPLVLIANPGSASRKYAVYRGKVCLAQLHFEHMADRVTCTLSQEDEPREVEAGISELDAAAGQLLPILLREGILQPDDEIHKVGLRIVAPHAFFLQDQIVDDGVVAQLEALLPRAPLHIRATLNELRVLREQFPAAEAIGISDSAFHITKPDYAWNYAIPLRDADQFDIKRFGYHGLSAAAAVHSLHSIEKLPPKVIICHLGSGVSVTAVHQGKSLDTTMGYSPLEGPAMATRSGTIDPTAVRALQQVLGLDDEAMQEYLNKHSGLLGLSGRSSDVRDLLQFEAEGDHYAHLALQVFVYNIQKAVGQMATVLGGADILVFTGAMGERSAVIRERILHTLHFLDFMVDSHANNRCIAPQEVTLISKIAHSRPVFVIPTDEAGEMLRRIAKL